MRGHVWDELERIGERGDDEGVVVRERSLEQIEAYGAGIQQDHAGCVGTRGVYHGLLQRGREEGVNVRRTEERRAGLAPGLRGAAVEGGEVEGLAVGIDCVGCCGALRGVQGGCYVEGGGVSVIGEG